MTVPIIHYCNGRTRIPDAINRSLQQVIEVKNVASQGLTQQIKDSIQIAQERGYQFVLYVRENTQLSKPLQQAISNGTVQLQRMSNDALNAAAKTLSGK